MDNEDDFDTCGYCGRQYTGGTYDDCCPDCEDEEPV
jgi:hypothetical protein